MYTQSVGELVQNTATQRWSLYSFEEYITVLCIVSLDIYFNDLFVYNAHNVMFVMEWVYVK